AVAISTPSLWSKVTFSLNIDTEKNNSLAEVFTTRVKHVPADIRIHAYSDYMDEEQLAEIGSSKYPYLRRAVSVASIDTLTLALVGEADFGAFLIGNMDIIYDKAIKNLSIEVNKYTEEPIDSFLAKCLPMRKLSLLNLRFGSTLDKHLSLGLSNVTELSISMVYHFSLLSLLRITPMIQKLELWDYYTENREHSDEVWESSTLRSLSVFYSRIPWEHIRCSQLTRIQFPKYWDWNHASFWPFLKRTSTITEFSGGFIRQSQDFVRLANTAPQITSLIAEARPSLLELLTDSQDFELQEPAFPDLIRLTILIWDDKTPYSTLEKFIRARCLPRDHILSTMDHRLAHPLKALTVIIERDLFNGQWKRLLEANFIRISFSLRSVFLIDVASYFLMWRTARVHVWDNFDVQPLEL
ncbi:hypothetical protein M408DRAFT_305115, partial [Serendipita vermifera MAFF 305830]